MTSMKRRDFLEFLGRSSLFTAVGGSSLAALLSSCTHNPISPATKAEVFPFIPISPDRQDRLLLAEGFRYDVLIKWGDPINKKGELFGFNNDFTATLPTQDPHEALLWVNHETADPIFVSRYSGSGPKSKAQVIAEQKNVGGSLIKVQQEPLSRRWSVDMDCPLNRRLDATTPIPFSGQQIIAGSQTAIGTLANCAGGKTPWGTILTCEENYDDYYGEILHRGKMPRLGKAGLKKYQWERYYNHPPEHYGWVVEFNPQTGAAKKLVGLGRFAHECATVRAAPNGRCAVYSGDDAEDMCLYKFIAAKPGSLDTGVLYVANLEQGRWIPLDYSKNQKLRDNFDNPLDVLIDTRLAAELVGGTSLDRPEDIEIDPQTGAVLIAITGNPKKGDNFGSILKIEEKDNDPLALEFKSSTFLAGGPETLFACPDNMAFDLKGNLWLTSDISGKVLNKPPYAEFGNNGLFYIPTQGPQAGHVLQVASAPTDAEFTGPSFSADGRTLFLSVQHPGELSPDFHHPTSHWPEGGDSTPRSAVVAITGAAMDRLMDVSDS